MGRAHGLGRIKHSDGDSYCGEWLHGRAHGCGVYRFQDGAACYEGQFRCDQREGLGVESWVDGSCDLVTGAGGVPWGGGEETGGLMWLLLRWGKLRKGSMDSYSLLDEARMNHELCGWFLFMLESLWCKWENERDQDPKDDLVSSTAIPTSC